MNTFTKIKDLQEKIKSCDDNLKAIEMQDELLKLLSELLKDKNSIASLLKLKNINKL